MQGRGAQARPGLLRPLRQRIESVNQTLKGQLDLEHHGGRTIQGVTARVLQRLLALTAAIWHNHHTNQPVPRSLLAYRFPFVAYVRSGRVYTWGRMPPEASPQYVLVQRRTSSGWRTIGRAGARRGRRRSTTLASTC